MAPFDFKDRAPSLQQLQSALDQAEAGRLSPFATLNRNGQRRHHEQRLVDGYRQHFSLDADRILHSRAYTRYIDKTQVFSLIRNDHITHRVLHVQLVSKIARTIGRFLQLNEDLIEAIALGHDIGHTPFGHEGERYLSALCKDHGIGFFLHNVQSIQFLDRVERKGQGWNLCLQTLDGILCHDGEIHNQSLTPKRDKNFDDLAREMARKKADPEYPLIPMTLEGCIVRMADTIAYIGRDLEDAIRLGYLHRQEIPADVVAVLGDSNGTIVYTLVTDVIKNSHERNQIAFSEPVSDALRLLKNFNLDRIYLNPRTKWFSDAIRVLFEHLFENYLRDIHQNNHDSLIFRGLLENMSTDYVEQHTPAEIVRDFISGMTDNFFLEQCPPDLRPNPLAAGVS
ncbi:MAG: HD domain-containing protein [Desulfosarcinaceae bacterium]|nr:HD domain-containing protein [Desulfosarcinaceae bacterium]